MAISDTVASNLTTLYLIVIAVMKAYGLASGKSFSGVCVLVLSTAIVALILIGSLTWDVSRKATHALTTKDHGHEMCRGGICWHGVAVKSPASQVRKSKRKQQLATEKSSLYIKFDALKTSYNYVLGNMEEFPYTIY